MKDKSLTILGILNILWGVLLLCYKIFCPKSVYDLVGNDGFQLSLQEIESKKAMLQNINNIIYFFLLVSLVVLLIVLIVRLKKIGIKVASNGIFWGTIFALIMYIVGLSLVSFIFTIMCGIFLIIYKKKDNT